MVTKQKIIFAKSNNEMPYFPLSEGKSNSFSNITQTIPYFTITVNNKVIIPYGNLLNSILQTSVCRFFWVPKILMKLHAQK
jgi:hypothetical protein